MSDPITPALTAEEWAGNEADPVSLEVRRGSTFIYLTHGTQLATGGTQRALNGLQQVTEPDAFAALIAMANQLLPDSDPRKITQLDADAVSDALYQLHGPKMDGPRNDLERTLLLLSEKLRAILPP